VASPGTSRGSIRGGLIRQTGCGSVFGSLLAALIFGPLGVRARERSSVLAVLMPFGLGLGVLFLSLYTGRSANKFSSLLGQIVAVDDPQLIWLSVITVVVLASLAILWRPLMFATVDPEIAAARGVPVRALSPVFMIVLGLAVAMSVQVVGALLVLALLVTLPLRRCGSRHPASGCLSWQRSSPSPRWSAGLCWQWAGRSRSALTSRRSRSPSMASAG